VTVSPQDEIPTPEGSRSALTRRVCELRELADSLQSQQNELVERERIHELEIVAQRRELEVRFAFEATLEERLLDYQREIERLHAQVEMEVQRRFAAELLAESARVAQAQRERDDVRRELDAERRRISYRAVQRAVVPITKGRAVFAKLRRTGRVMRDRFAPSR
jgi:hypothetical protein